MGPHRVRNNQRGWGWGYSDYIMVTFSSLLQKASNFPNIYISETSKDFSPEDSKICFLVLWNDVWYSLNRKMQSYEKIKRREQVMRLFSGVSNSRICPHAGMITTAPQQELLLLTLKLKFSAYILKSPGAWMLFLLIYIIFSSSSFSLFPFSPILTRVCHTFFVHFHG